VDRIREKKFNLGLLDIRNDSDVVGVCRGIIMSINKTKDVT